MGVAHILLSDGDQVQPGLWRVTNRGPKLLLERELEALGYPVARGENNIYLAFEIVQDEYIPLPSWDAPEFYGRVLEIAKGGAHLITLDMLVGLAGGPG